MAVKKDDLIDTRKINNLLTSDADSEGDYDQEVLQAFGHKDNHEPDSARSNIRINSNSITVRSGIILCTSHGCTLMY